MPTALRNPFAPRTPLRSRLPFPSHPLDVLPAALNHLLAAEPWARHQLVPFFGRTIEIVALPFTIRLTVVDRGEVARAPAEAVADTSIRIPGAALIRFVASPDAAMRDARIAGDEDFAQVVARLARHLRWDVENDLAKITGDVVAHRVVGAARGAAGAMRRAGERFASGLGEYWLEENPTLVRPRAVAALADGVRRLRDDLARLEQRVDRLPPPA